MRGFPVDAFPHWCFLVLVFSCLLKVSAEPCWPRGNSVFIKDSSVTVSTHWPASCNTGKLSSEHSWEKSEGMDLHLPEPFSHSQQQLIETDSILSCTDYCRWMLIPFTLHWYYSTLSDLVINVNFSPVNYYWDTGCSTYLSNTEHRTKKSFWHRTDVSTHNSVTFLSALQAQGSGVLPA